MEQILEFTNYAEVKVNEYTQTAEVTMYVEKTPALELHQKLIKGCCCKKTIFCIQIKNNSNRDIENLELIDWICSNGTVTIKCIELEEGCYHLHSHHISFYIPLLQKKEQLYIILSLCNNSSHHITNCIKATHFTMTSSLNIKKEISL